MSRFVWVLIGTLIASDASAQGSPLRLTLADAVNRGFENSHRIAEIKAREAGARAAAKSVELSKLPTISASSGYTRTNHVQEFSVPQPGGTRLVVYPDIPNTVVTRVGFQWPVFTSGRADALERAAEAEASAAAADIETARADLRLEIIRAYWAAVTAREGVRVLEESAARVQAQLYDARQRFKVGLIAPNEVSSLEAQRSREQSQFIEARNLLQSALIDLQRLIGAERGTVIELSDSLDRQYLVPKTTTVSALIASAIESRPERQTLSLRLGGLEARRQAVQAINKPSISAAGGVDYANPNPRIFPRKGEW